MTLKPEKINVVELPPHHWSCLQAAFESEGSPLPDPERAGILAAMSDSDEDRGALMGFGVTWACQCQGRAVIHFEPVYVFPAYRGLGVHTLLEEAFEGMVARAGGGSYFTTATERAMERTAEGRGFVRAGVLMRKDVASAHAVVAGAGGDTK